jgi:hypothetical protein
VHDPVADDVEHEDEQEQHAGGAARDEEPPERGVLEAAGGGARADCPRPALEARGEGLDAHSYTCR